MDLSPLTNLARIGISIDTGEEGHILCMNDGPMPERMIAARLVGHIPNLTVVELEWMQAGWEPLRFTFGEPERRLLKDLMGKLKTLVSVLAS